MLEPVGNSTIYNVRSRMYYQYFTFKGLDYTRNIVFPLIFLQVFFQRSIFRKLRITVISSSHWNVVSTFWVILGMVRYKLMKPLIFGDDTKIITRFILNFSKMLLFCLLCLTIKRDITLHKRATVHIWFIKRNMKNQWDSIHDLMKLFYTLYFLLKIYLTAVATAWFSFASSLVNC